jgi:PII-like signaling protein
VLTSGPAKKVAIYVAEDQQFHGNSAYAAVLDFLFFRGVSGATVSRGIAGFGADHHMHTNRLVELATRLPVKIEFIETAEKVQELLPKLQSMVGTGLIEMHDTTIVKPAESDKDAKKDYPASGKPALKREGKAKLMRIYVGENDKWNGKPLYEAIVNGLRAHDIAGVTVYRGILGYGANRRIHKDAALSLSHDRPILLSIIDTEEKLRAFMPILDQMVQQGLVVLSDVDVIKYTHDYQATDRRQESRA